MKKIVLLCLAVMAGAAAAFAAKPVPVPVKNEFKLSGEFVKAGELPQPLTIVRQATPRYPLIWRNAGIGGKVQLIFIVDEKGRPEEVQVVEASDAAFGEAAVEAVKQWRYKPVKVADKPVRVAVVQVLTFNLDML